MWGDLRGRGVAGGGDDAGDLGIEVGLGLVNFDTDNHTKGWGPEVSRCIYFDLRKAQE